METKGNKILMSVCTWWISIFALTKLAMEEYCTLLLKRGLDAPTKAKVVANLEHLVDVEVLLSLSYVFPLLEVVNILIKFTQM
jgi:hypothetical protein